MHFQEPVLTAHSPQRLRGLVRGTENTERGYIFWRIGERPILQKTHGLLIELPKTLQTFDLVASHHQIKKIQLCDLGDSAVKAIYFVVPLMIVP